MIETFLGSAAQTLFVLVIFTAGVVFGYWARKNEE
tara:strand:+ start:82 stop:186 length:105 start_codon:yes stop_codon:yes gene_type:complete